MLQKLYDSSCLGILLHKTNFQNSAVCRGLPVNAVSDVFQIVAVGGGGKALRKCNSLKNVYDVHLSLVNPVSTLLCQQIIKRLFSLYFFEFKMKKNYLNKIRKIKSKKLHTVKDDWLYP